MDVATWFRLDAGRAGALGTRLLVAFVLGAAVGLAAGPRVEVLAPLTALFITTLRYLAPVMVVVFLVEALGGPRPITLGPANARALVAFAAMAVASAALGVATGLAWPGLPARPAPASPLALPRGAHLADWFGRGVTLDVVIVWAVVVAVPLSMGIGWWHRRAPHDTGARLHRLAVGAARGLTQVIGMLMLYAPVGTFALAALMFGQSGAAAGADLARVVAVVYAAQIATVVALVTALAAGGRAVRSTLNGARGALVTALATGSSAVTLPVELRVAEHVLAVPPALARTVMPLGVSFSKAGTTAFLGALAAVGARLGGVEPSAGWVAGAVFASAVAGLVTPPISGGGFVMLALVFEQCGLPMGWVPLLVSIPFVGKLNTPINTLGRLVAALTASRHVAAPVDAATAPSS